MSLLGLPAELDAAIRVLLMLGFVFALVLALIWIERKVIGHIQMRLGPMRTGPHGLLQSPADAIKLLVKEDLMPQGADRWVYRVAPYVVFVPIFLVFVSLPFTQDLFIRDLDLGLFYIFAVSSFSIVGFIMAGWASDNKYALLGGARAVAQLVSYELPLVIAILGVAMLAGSLSLSAIVEKQSSLPYLLFQPLGLIIFLMAALAELNRTPFDIPLAESEVVGGPFVEYSGMRWGIFFLAEYANVFAISGICALLYLGGWRWPYLPPLELVGPVVQNLIGLGWFFSKTFLVILCIFWMRATFPRLRIDQLMNFAWKVLIPISLLNLLVTGLHLLYRWPDPVLVILSLALAGGGGYALSLALRPPRYVLHRGRP